MLPGTPGGRPAVAGSGAALRRDAGPRTPAPAAHRWDDRNAIDRLGGEVRRDVDINGLLRTDVALENAPERRAELGGGRVPITVTRDRG